MEHLPPKRIQDSSPEAVFVQHQASVRWQIGRFVPDLQAVDDLAQEVFIAWYQSTLAESSEPVVDSRAWLLRVARNKAIDWVRARTRLPVSTGFPNDFLDAESVRDLAQRSGETDDNEIGLTALRHCLGLLLPEHREILEEYYSQGKSSELIAVRLGKGSSGVRMMLTRIRRSLGKCIRRQLEKRR